jgi:hypothetical protein
MLQYLPLQNENQRQSDGCMPDRVEIDGTPVYSPGATGAGFADHAIDNQAFSALLLTSFMDAWSSSSLEEEGNEREFFCEMEPKVRRCVINVGFLDDYYLCMFVL